jgi:hypothetical protein
MLATCKLLGGFITFVVMGSNTTMFARVATNETAKETICIFSVDEDNFHGCKTLKPRRQTIAHTARRPK